MRSKMVELQVHILSTLAVPMNGGVSDALKFLTEMGDANSPSRQKVRDAAEFAKRYVAAVRAAGEPNPWKNATDEEIAEQILIRIKSTRDGHGNHR